MQQWHSAVVKVYTPFEKYSCVYDSNASFNVSSVSSASTGGPGFREKIGAQISHITPCRYGEEIRERLSGTWRDAQTEPERAESGKSGKHRRRCSGLTSDTDGLLLLLLLLLPSPACDLPCSFLVAGHTRGDTEQYPLALHVSINSNASKIRSALLLRNSNAPVSNIGDTGTP